MSSVFQSVELSVVALWRNKCRLRFRFFYITGKVLTVCQQVAVESCLLPFTLMLWMSVVAKRVVNHVTSLPRAALTSLRTRTKYGVDRVRLITSQPDELTSRVTDSLDALSQRGRDMMAHGSRSTLEAARATLDAARDSTIGAARARLEGLVPKEAPCSCLTTRVVTYGIQGLLNIQELTLALRLSVARRQYIKGSMTSVIQGKQESFNFDLNSRSAHELLGSMWRQFWGPTNGGRRQSLPARLVELNDAGVTGLRKQSYGSIQNGEDSTQEQEGMISETKETSVLSALREVAAEKLQQELEGTPSGNKTHM